MIKYLIGICRASETQVIGAGIRRVLRPGRTPVPVTVILVAHKAPAFLYLIRSRRGTGWIDRRICRIRRLVPNGPPIRRPLPHIADHMA